MEQTIIKIGNSQGIIIPQKILAAAGIKAGDKVVVTEENNKITVAQLENNVKNVVDQEVYSVAKKLLKRYSKAFAELANK